MDIDYIERLLGLALERFKAHAMPISMLCMVIHPDQCKAVSISELVRRVKMPILVTLLAPTTEFLLMQADDVGNLIADSV